MEAIANCPDQFVNFVDKTLDDAATDITRADSVCLSIKAYPYHAVVCVGFFLMTPIMITVGLIAAAIFGSISLCTDEHTSKFYQNKVLDSLALAALGLFGILFFPATLFYPPCGEKGYF